MDYIDRDGRDALSVAPVRETGVSDISVREKRPGRGGVGVLFFLSNPPPDGYVYMTVWRPSGLSLQFVAPDRPLTVRGSSYNLSSILWVSDH